MKDQQHQLSKKGFRELLYSNDMNEFNIAVQAMFSRAHYPCLMAFIKFLREDEEDLFASYAQDIPPRYYDELYSDYLRENSILIRNFYYYLIYVNNGRIVIHEDAKEYFLRIISTLEYVCKAYEHPKGIIVIAQTAKKYKPSLFTILLYTIRKIYFIHKLIIFNENAN